MSNAVTKWFVGLFSSLGKVFKPIEQQAVSDFEAKVAQLGPEGIDLMEDAITATASLGLGDTAARDAAITKFKADAIADGKDLATWAKNEFNTLLELVYVAMKPTVTNTAAAGSTAAPTATATAGNTAQTQTPGASIT